ncbi:WD40-repeat-containing domain protein [Phlyctochytrium arcticum]|nr:WD40-repeat-containing domain protein [Phlyctochytrium arcticum]
MSTANTNLGFELGSPPSDGISSVVFSPEDPSLLLAGSWDSKIRLYDVSRDELRHEWTDKKAVLDVCFPDATHAYAVGLDRTLKRMDMNSTTQSTVGSHDDAIRCVGHAKTTNQIFTGSWDKYVGVWDPRSNACLGKYAQPHKVFSMDIINYTLVVATAGRTLCIYDIRNMQETSQCRESTLKHMTRIVRCFPDGEGFASGSIEGRIAIEVFDASSKLKKYAFKCHRNTVDEIEHIYPVNAIAFHPVYGTFVSGGSDGLVCVWDGYNKRKMRQFPRYPTGISSLAFNCDASLLAVASSYTYDELERDHPADTIYVRTMENECKPKSAAA